MEGNAPFQREVSENEMQSPPEFFPHPPEKSVRSPELRRQAKLICAVSSQESGYPGEGR